MKCWRLSVVLLTVIFKVVSVNVEQRLAVRLACLVLCQTVVAAVNDEFLLGSSLALLAQVVIVFGAVHTVGLVVKVLLVQRLAICSFTVALCQNSFTLVIFRVKIDGFLVELREKNVIDFYLL